MSDYLSNLAAKSLDAVATIRPRLASFYEAPQRGFALPPEPGQVTNDVVVAPAQPAESRALAEASPPAAITDHSVADVVVNNVQPRTATITASVVSEETSAASTPAQPTPRRAADRVAASAVASSAAPPAVDDVVSESPRERPGRREVSATIASPERAIEPARDTETHVEPAHPPRIAARIAAPTEQSANAQPHAETEPPLAREPRQPFAPPELPSRSQPKSKVANDFAPPGEPPRSERSVVAAPQFPPPSPITTPHRITPSRIFSESQPGPRAQPVPQSPRLHPQPPPAPDVHITIGRVEVRAVAAAEPPPRGRSTAPSSLMNLDDYLRRRDGRGRR